MSTARALPASFLYIIRTFVVIFALLMLWTVLPAAPARAAGLTDAQLASIASLLQSYQVDQDTIDAVKERLQSAKIMTASTTSAMGGILPPAAACGQLMRNLGKGDSGEDVAHLQDFLRGTGDLHDASSTGFFGPKTEEALKSWQARTGIVSSGDSSTTGFGAFGPRTRQLLITQCKGREGSDNSNASSSPAAASGTAPTCTLTADQDSVVATGGSVTLVWQSENATWASSANGLKGPPSGSIVVTPRETTTYVKKVYGPGGQSSCTATVEVNGDDTSSPIKKVVQEPVNIDLANVVSAIGSGMGVVVDAYIGLFHWSQ